MMKKEQCCVALEKSLVAGLLSHCYMIISLINIVGFFCWDTIEISLYTLLGNHSIMLYPFWGLLIVSDLEVKWLVIGLLLYWVVNVFLCMFAYITVLAQKRYRLFQIVVFIDSVFSLLFAIVNWKHGGFLDLHIAIIIGALINFLFAWYLHWYESGRTQKKDDSSFAY